MKFTIPNLDKKIMPDIALTQNLSYFSVTIMIKEVKTGHSLVHCVL
jgi:hypothetical protein